MSKSTIFYFLLLCFITSPGKAQEIHSHPELQNIPANYYTKIEHKFSSIAGILTKKSLKYLQKFKRREDKFQNKMRQFNSPGSKDLVFETDRKYNDLFNEVTSERTPDDVKLTQYNSYLDTVSTAFFFLCKDRSLPVKVKLPVFSLDKLKSRINQSDKIKEFLGERERQIHEVLSKCIKLPAALKKAFQRVRKTNYYYSAEVNEIKNLLNDPKKLERKALAILNKLPAFKAFMRENGQLASLFQIPGNSNSIENLTGLQTIMSVQSLIQQNVSTGGINASAQIQQFIGLAHNEIEKLKYKINEYGGGNSDAAIPGFKPNSQKVKAFLKRLEYSADIQFSKIPLTTGIGLGVGYKLNDKSVIGIGMSYKMGIGKLAHIAITSQGIGLRSFMDWKIKKQVFVSGGYEMNFNTSFKNINQLKEFNAWQLSAFLGMSKKYRVSKKVRGELKLLYDLLANSHQPVSESLVFRMGYKF